MDKHGIGTDATHAEHIEKIKTRDYVGLTATDNRLIPGFLGLGLVEGYDLMGFEMSKPHLRAELEADLKRICEGQIFCYFNPLMPEKFALKSSNLSKRIQKSLESVH